MIEFKRILCPVDFSESSRHAVDHAAAIAGWYGARLTIIHVFPTAPVMDLPPIVLERTQRDHLMDELRTFTAHLPATLASELRVEQGFDVHEEILRQARVSQADLLVMGSHGRSAIGRLLLGSVTEKVIRSSPCPSMIVPRDAPDRAPKGPVAFNRILCPIDFSAGSDCALQLALGLAEEADASLTLLHVLEMPPELQESPVTEDIDIPRLHAAAEADRLARLREMIPNEARTYCTVETSVRDGAADRAILHTAKERQADLIVMGVQGRGALDLMVFGSNTARVIRNAACPVLIARKMGESQSGAWMRASARQGPA
jgi:nucleotide-binding universal stress UspA family protein